MPLDSVRRCRVLQNWSDVSYSGACSGLFEAGRRGCGLSRIHHADRYADNLNTATACRSEFA